MADIGELLRSPERRAALTWEERQQAIEECAGLIIALTVAPVSSRKGADRALTAEQVAERLNVPVSWVRQNARSHLASVVVELGGHIRYSENRLNEFLQRRNGA